MNVTRFNPTANGPLHVGHIYSALINETLAGPAGKFIVRIDYNCRYWWQRNGGPAGMAEIAARFGLTTASMPIAEASESYELLLTRAIALRAPERLASRPGTMRCP